MPTLDRELTVCELNAENLFVSMAYQDGRPLESLSEDEWRGFALAQLRRRQKPLWQLLGLAEAIADIDPDILMMVEVGGEDSLGNFNRHFLGDRYEAHFVAGNSRRGIDLGFLVRRGLGFRAEARSHREAPVEIASLRGKRAARFSRDVAELRLYSPEDGGLRLILLLAHLKSKISSLDDYQGKDTRTAEAIALAEIYERTRAEHPGTPVVVGGDFNADISSLELELVKRTDLTDFHDLLATPAGPAERASLVFFDHAGQPRPQVLDYLLVSPHLKSRVVPARSFTYRYKAFHGIPVGLPETPKQRHQMPSDHFPLVLTLRV